MKRILISLIAIITLCSSASAVSFSWVSSKLSGDKTLPSTKNEVSAYGFNFRTYTYVDGAGRLCTTAFTDEKAGGLDCEFPPKDFDYEEFLKRANK
jgi:hypothetical protein